MLEILAIIVLAIITFPIMVPALIIAAATTLTLWPTFWVLFAAAIFLAGVVSVAK